MHSEPTSAHHGNRRAGAEEAKIVREMIRHEDELINHRITWMMVFNGLLYTALGLVVGRSNAKVLLWVLTCLGCVIAVSSFLGIYDGTKGIRNVRKWWDEHVAEDFVGPDVMALRGKSTHFRLLKPWRVMPWVFFVSWLVIGITYGLK